VWGRALLCTRWCENIALFDQWSWVTLSDSNIFNDTKHRAASLWQLGLLTVASLRFPVPWISARKLFKNVLIRHYYWLDVIDEVCLWNSLACSWHNRTWYTEFTHWQLYSSSSWSRSGREPLRHSSPASNSTPPQTSCSIVSWNV